VRSLLSHKVISTDNWKWHTLLLNRFEDDDATSGNGVLDLDNLTYIGYSLLSATANGIIDIKIDEIALSTVPTSDDTDGDGLPNWWKNKQV